MIANTFADVVAVLMWIAVGIAAVWLVTRVVFATVRAQQRRERRQEAARRADRPPVDDD